VFVDQDGISNEQDFTQIKDTIAPQAPMIIMLDDANSDGVISENESSSQIAVNIRPGFQTEIGDTLNITNPDGTTLDVEVTQDILTNGLTLNYEQPEDGEILAISATVTDQNGNQSESYSRAINIDTSYGNDIDGNGVIDLASMDVILPN